MRLRTTILLLALGQLLSIASAEAKPKKKHPAVKHAATTAAAKSHAAEAKGHSDEAKRSAKAHRQMVAKHVAARGVRSRVHVYGERFTASSFADDITLG